MPIRRVAAKAPRNGCKSQDLSAAQEVKVFCFFFSKKEESSFFEKRSQKTFVPDACPARMRGLRKIAPTPHPRADGYPNKE
jgi:hypothetical protein